MAANRITQSVYEQVLRRNPGEAEFHQAVKEVLDSLGPVLDKNTSIRGFLSVLSSLRG